MNKMSKLLAGLGVLAALCGPAFAADVIVPRTITTNTTWTKNNTYFLEGYSFVVAPATLTIEPGTVIKGRQTTGANAAALIVTRGAKIEAAGTAAEPIIFTSELDQLNGNLDHTNTQLWGGVILLGNASINSRANGQPAGTPPQDQIEGLSVTGSEVGYATFGGTNDTESSGTLRYISIRHGGAVIGANNEINGLTLGGVGSGTTVEFIEVFANKDDGIELFGGTVNLKYVVTAFGNDDGIDYDQGWRGSVQFGFVIGTDIAPTVNESQDKAGEWDGATSPIDATPLTQGQLYNITFVGIGTAGRANTALHIRENAGAKVHNSVFLDFDKMLQIEANNQTRLAAGDVAFTHNVWWSHVAANNTSAGLWTGATDLSTVWSDTARNNTIANPMLRGISRTPNRGLDPRPIAGSPALTGPFATVPSGGFFTQANYKGAFNQNLWIAGWTKLSQDGYLTDAPGGRFTAISTRGTLAAGEQMTPGFVIEGTTARNVLIRAVGPGLSGIPGINAVVADPTLTVHRIANGVATVIGTNDNWNANLASIFARVGAGTLVASSNDAAIVLNLPPGVYTATAEGKAGNSGELIVEVYEVP